MCSKTMMFAPPSLSIHAQQERTKRSTSTIKKTDGSSSPLANQSKLHFITPTEIQHKQVCSFHQSLKRTTKHPSLEQQEERGHEAIGADPELTEDHEEDTEGHSGEGELDRIVVGDAPGEVRETLMCLRTLLSRRWQPHYVACLMVLSLLVAPMMTVCPRPFMPEPCD